ncbi:hypothetical protein RND81_09G094800 [Saponaria officinalis]|uniref:Uncharacterized protein n=1 Tax=Saponaria officinalis TaxID=3572 RepID=A0AAW1IIR6_SAPOF
MDVLGGGGGGAWWSHHPFNDHRRRIKRRGERNRKQKASSESTAPNSVGKPGFRFPIKQALTAGSLAFAGDSIAQLTHRWKTLQSLPSISEEDNKDFVASLLSGHDWLRALRMTSYGFLFYGPASYVWYQTLDRYLPQPTVTNLLVKVLLNQIILGPAVIAVVFAWNNLWQGKVSELPGKYQKDALPTLLFGFRFWVPYSFLNFWCIPLQARVAFMSLGSIFWNFILSSTMSK